MSLSHERQRFFHVKAFACRLRSRTPRAFRSTYQSQCSFRRKSRSKGRARSTQPQRNTAACLTVFVEFRLLLELKLSFFLEQVTNTINYSQRLNSDALGCYLQDEPTVPLAQLTPAEAEAAKYSTQNAFFGTSFHQRCAPCGSLEPSWQAPTCCPGRKTKGKGEDERVQGQDRSGV